MLGLLGGLLGGLGGILGGNETKKAAKRNAALLGQFQTNGLSTIDAGKNEAGGYLSDVGDLWKNFTDQTGGLSGLSLLGDALGVNGADGTAAARSAFQTSPGYGFQLGQGLDALERRAASQGRLSSGQTGLDTINYAQGLANSEYQNWLNSLGNFGNSQANLFTTGTTGQAGSLSDLASLATGTAGQKVNLMGEVVNGQMGANNQRAQGSQQMIQGGLGGLANMFGTGQGGGMFGGYL